jgi:hypothetical protein
MRSRTEEFRVKTHFFLSALVLAVAGGCMAQSQPQSLADVVKEKKTAKKAVLVLSDEDLPPPSATLADDDTDKDSGPAAAEKTTDSKTDSAAKSKEQDSKTADSADAKDKKTKELKQKLAFYKQREDVWKNSIQHYEELLANETSDFRRQAYQDALDNDKHNAALYQQKIDEVQTELNKSQQGSEQSGSAHPDSGSTPDAGSQP